MTKVQAGGLLVVILGLIAGYFGLNLEGCKVTEKPSVTAPAQ